MALLGLVQFLGLPPRLASAIADMGPAPTAIPPAPTAVPPAPSAFAPAPTAFPPAPTAVPPADMELYFAPFLLFITIIFSFFSLYQTEFYFPNKHTHAKTFSTVCTWWMSIAKQKGTGASHESSYLRECNHIGWVHVHFSHGERTVKT